MTCNGNNHGMHCKCGWGGVFYGTGLTGGRSEWQRHESYTNPNSRCPVCNVPVYFYQSQYGGKVYFDEMGPPWPKHPCTDITQATTYNLAKSQDKIKSTSSLIKIRTPEYQQEGWFPIYCSEIDTIPEEPTVLILKVGEKSEGKQLFANITQDKVSAHWPILVRRIPNTKAYEVSTLKAREAVPSEFRFKAYLTLQDLIQSNQLTQPISAVVTRSVPNDLDEKRILKKFAQIKRSKITIDDIKLTRELKAKHRQEIENARKTQEIERAARRAEAERQYASKLERKAKTREQLIKENKFSDVALNTMGKSKHQIKTSPIPPSQKLQTSVELAFEKAAINPLKRTNKLLKKP